MKQEIFYIFKPGLGQGAEYEAVQGTRINIVPWADLFIYKNEKGSYSITDTLTGRAIIQGHFEQRRKDVIAGALKRLNMVGEKRYREVREKSFKDDRKSVIKKEYGLPPKPWNKNPTHTMQDVIRHCNKVYKEIENETFADQLRLLKHEISFAFDMDEFSAGVIAENYLRTILGRIK